jgi:hypothetical protein
MQNAGLLHLSASSFKYYRRDQADRVRASRPQSVTRVPQKPNLVNLSLHIDYKNSRIEQYFKQAPEVREMGARPRPSSTTRATFHRQAAA